MEIRTTSSMKRWLPFAVLAAYATLLAVVMAFHEPWFDEAQSWLIARDASVREMLFTIPHYEGHPPLWWLMLAVPAKLGLPYELSIKGINFVFSVFAVYLILFKSPFPLWVKCILPFTYFLFYQYGVQSRPYSIMECAVFLAAITWVSRDCHPFRFALALMLLCLTSAYGIIIAGGIALAWTCEALEQRTLFRNRERLAAMLALLALAVALIFFIFPYPDTYAHSRVFSRDTNTLAQCFFHAFFSLPSEATVSSFGDDKLIVFFSPVISQTVFMAAVSISIWAALIGIAHRRKTLLYLVFPSVLFLSFSAIKYFAFHHVGIVFMLFLFSLWISCTNAKPESLLSDNRKLRMVLAAAVGIALIVNSSWSVTASVNEINTCFSAGKALAAFVKENQLEDYRWSTYWETDYDEDDEDQITFEDTHMVSTAVIEANPYLANPLLGDMLSGKSFVDHIHPTEKGMQEEKERLIQRGTDIVIGMPLGEKAREILGLNEKYVVLTTIESGGIWKNKKGTGITFVCGTEEIARLIKEGGDGA